MIADYLMIKIADSCIRSLTGSRKMLYCILPPGIGFVYVFDSLPVARSRVSDLLVRYYFSDSTKSYIIDLRDDTLHGNLSLTIDGNSRRYVEVSDFWLHVTAIDNDDAAGKCRLINQACSMIH